FSHDGRKLMAVFAVTRRRQDAAVWILPWPAGSGAAHRVETPALAGRTINSADWLLDGRPLVAELSTLSLSSTSGLPGMSLIDSQSGGVWRITADNSDAVLPSVGPDGRILYTRQRALFDLVGIPVDGSARNEVLSSDWVESFGAWSRVADEIVYVGDRGGE